MTVSFSHKEFTVVLEILSQLQRLGVSLNIFFFLAVLPSSASAGDKKQNNILKICPTSNILHISAPQDWQEG